jgi:hypothetical protein
LINGLTLNDNYDFEPNLLNLLKEEAKPIIYELYENYQQEKVGQLFENPLGSDVMGNKSYQVKGDLFDFIIANLDQEKSDTDDYKVLMYLLDFSKNNDALLVIDLYIDH